MWEGETGAQILYYARLCRVERVIRPYLKALARKERPPLKLNMAAQV